MPRVNPDILVWARETAGLSLREAAKRIALRDARGVPGAERLRMLETGEDEPSRAQLAKMATKYRRPLLTFYLAQRPRKGDRGQDFRTLPEEPPPGAEAILDTLLRGVRAKQALLRAAIEDEEEARVLPFVGSNHLTDGLRPIVAALQSAIGVSVEEYRRQPSSDDAFDLLRARAEAAGVYVLLIGDLGSHHSSLDIDIFRGFALADPVAPFIVINDNDARVAWSFTLLHEFVHILLGQTGISGGTPDKGIERFCNDTASAFLLPEVEIREASWPPSSDTAALSDAVAEFAGPRRISRQMVAYRLFRAGVLHRQEWVSLHRHFRAVWEAETSARTERQAGKKGGPDFYVVRRHRLGRGLLETTSRMMSTGALTTARAGRVLGIRPGQVKRLLAGIEGSALPGESE
jgi:Zn-dependent peptidase ImmA (M78 family)/transcriptional regulator with XRE-family HTH domain